MANKAFEPTEEQRKLVKRASAVGLTGKQIATVLNISERTVWKYFQEDMAKGIPEANMAVAGALFNSAMKGNVTAQIFWCKVRLGWKESSHIDLSGTPLIPVLELHINGVKADK